MILIIPQASDASRIDFPRLIEKRTTQQSFLRILFFFLLFF